MKFLSSRMSSNEMEYEDEKEGQVEFFERLFVSLAAAAGSEIRTPAVSWNNHEIPFAELKEFILFFIASIVCAFVNFLRIFEGNAESWSKVNARKVKQREETERCWGNELKRGSVRSGGVKPSKLFLLSSHLQDCFSLPLSLSVFAAIIFIPSYSFSFLSGLPSIAFLFFLLDFSLSLMAVARVNGECFHSPEFANFFPGLATAASRKESRFNWLYGRARGEQHRRKLCHRQTHCSSRKELQATLAPPTIAERKGERKREWSSEALACS